MGLDAALRPFDLLNFSRHAKWLWRAPLTRNSRKYRLNHDYTAEVRRFGASKPFRDADGKRSNLSHKTNFAEDAVITDGKGNVVHMPLLENKPCFGRPERYIRGIFDVKDWQDQDGNTRNGSTPCLTCENRTLGTYLACHDLSVERIESSPSIEAALIRWSDGNGLSSGPRCFVGTNAQTWSAVLAAIEEHGGWTSINDEQVKVAAVTAHESEKKRRREAAKARRKRNRDQMAGKVQPLPREVRDALKEERDRRAAHLKCLRSVKGQKPQDTLWLRNLSDGTCERVANVWHAREVLNRERGIYSGKAIAEYLLQAKLVKNVALSTLQARVSDDLKRLKKLEFSNGGAPLWHEWSYTD